jgi:hypothetical protein
MRNYRVSTIFWIASFYRGAPRKFSPAPKFAHVLLTNTERVILIANEKDYIGMPFYFESDKELFFKKKFPTLVIHSYEFKGLETSRRFLDFVTKVDNSNS